MDDFTRQDNSVENGSSNFRRTLLLVLVLASFGLYAQQDFRVRQVDTVRGDIIMVGNTILGLTDNPPNSAYDVLGTSNGGDGMNTSYIDIDGNNSTFSSSSADIISPNDECAEIRYAGLYWTANYYMAREDPISNGLTFGIRANNGSFTGFYTAVRSAFRNDTSSDNPVTANLVLANDIRACGGLANQAQIAGNIAVIRLGNCRWRDKVVNAQNAGAIGVILVNTNGATGPVTGNGGTTITIPTVTIGNDDIAGDDLITLIQNSAAPISGTVGQEQASNVVMTINNTTIAGVYPVGVSGFTNDNSDIRLSPASSNLVTNNFAGNIAVIREGADNRVAVLNAQNAGAVGVVVVGNTAARPTLTGGGGAINIPSIAIGNADINGQDLISLLGTESNVVNATLSTTGNEQLTGLPATDPRINGTADYRDIMLGFGAPGAVNYVPVQPQTGVQVVNGVTTHSGIIYDGYAGTTSNPGNLGTDNIPYTAYADVTSIVQANGFGTYTVGNMKATLGETSGVSGAAAGWTLVVMFEDPTPSATNVVRFMSTFDGFREIQGNQNGVGSTVALNINGFTTLPAPLPVNVNFGVASLEGDNGIPGDNLFIQNAMGVDVPLADVNNINPINNFFNSSISVNGAYYPNRNPASLNTLGFDSDFFDLNNGNNGNNLIPNGATSADFTLATVRDTYQAFLAAFSIENIVPQIRNIKEVFDPADLNVDINDGDVNLGDGLVYRLNLLNIGNEDIEPGTFVVVEDTLPANVDLLSIDGIDVSAQPNGNLNSIPSISYTTSGVGLGIEQTITFNIPAELLEQTDAEFNIDFLVQLVAQCEDLRDACSNVISNIAVTTYTGALSGIEVVDQPSSSRILDCGNFQGDSTNFLAVVPPCELETVFCGGTLRLEAGGGFDRYEWSGPNGFTDVTSVPFIDIVGAVGGSYTVTKIDTTPDMDGETCMTLTDQFDVVDFTAIPHPLEDDAATDDNIEYFEDCNVPLAKVNLCGNQSYTVDTGFDPGNLVNITWQELTNTDCFDRDDNCPAVTNGCNANSNWTNITTPPLTTSLDFVDAGEYRFVVEFEGGCVQIFYFDLNKNDYQPAVDIVDMECSNDGSVTVNNIASPTLTFLIRDQSDPAPTLPGDIGLFTNTTGVFPVAFQNNPFFFTVYAIDTAFPNCIFSVEGTVGSSTPVFLVEPTDPSCADDTFGNGFGSVAITVTNGLPLYEYRITGGPNNIDVTSGNGDTSNGNFSFGDLAPGNYNVEVTSNNPAPNCEFSQAITINEAPDFIAVVSLVTPETCDTGAIVQVNVTDGSGGPYLYADATGVFTANNQFEIPRPADPNATYTFSVSDQSSTPIACVITADIDGIQEYIPFTIDAVTPTNPDCPGDPGSIAVAVSSATPAAGRTFTYQLWDCANDPNCGDADPNNRDTSLWILVQEIGPTVSENINFVGLTDNDNYAVSVLHNNLGGATTDPICREDATIFEIETSGAVDATVEVTRELSCIAGQESAQVTINGFAGGSGTYEWSIDVAGPYTPVTLPNTVIDLTIDGNYTIFVRDPSAPDCPYTENIFIAPLLETTELVFNEITTDCNTQTIDIIVAATPLANDPPGLTFTYTVTPAAVSGDAATGEFTLNRGTTYTFTAQRSDNECEFSDDFSRAILPEIDITSALEAAPVVCNGEDNGSLSFTVGNSNTFDWEVTDSSNTTVGSGSEAGTDPTTVTVGTLGADTYTITVTDTSIASGACSDTTTVEVTEAELIVFETDATDSNCSADTGTITVTSILGGRGNYQYRLVNSMGTVIVDYPNTNTLFTGLAADTYTIFVRDGNDATTACEVSNTEIVGQFASPTIALVPGGDPCFDGVDQASQWVQITPGINPPLGPFEYILDRGAGPETPVAVTFLGTPNDDTFEIDNLAPGTYTVFVRNSATQCFTSTESFTINPELTITTVLDKDIDCNGDAVISFTPTGGSGTYTQFDLFIQGTPPTLSQANITSTHDISVPGEYIVQVTDDQNCTAFSNPIPVSAFEAIVATEAITAPDCPNEDGTITVTVSAGDGPFTYVLDGITPIGPTGDTSVTFDAAVGTHAIEITDGTGATPACTFLINNIRITNPDPIVATIDEDFRLLNCTATPEAQVQVTSITGGSGSYEWSLDNSTFTAVATTPFEVDFTTDGTFTLFIRNQGTEDCAQPFPITIDPLLEVDTVVVTPANQDCSAQTTEVTLSATPAAILPVIYEFEVSPNPATDVAGSSTGFSTTVNYTFTNGITYRVTARRSDTECTNFTDFNQPVVDEILITTATQSQAATCNGDNDGELIFTVDTATFTNFTFEITGPAPATTVVATGTFPADPLTATGLGAGDYTITVRDANAAITNNCIDIAIVPITEPEELRINTTVFPELTCTQDAIITVDVTGGNGGYMYTLVDSGGGTVGPQINNQFSVGTADNYTINVTDAESCPISTTEEVSDPDPIDAAIDASSDLCLDDGLVSFTINIDATDAGTPDYSYTVTRSGTVVIPSTDIGAVTTFTTTPDVTQAGNYIITITDSNGCSIEIPQTVLPAVELVVTQESDITCDAAGSLVDGEFSFAINGGYTPYDIDVIFNGGAPVNHITDGVAPFANYIATLGAGQYEFTVTDDRGCSFTTAPFRITDPIAPNITAPDVNVNCDGDLGTVVINVTGTEGPYQIDFNGEGLVPIVGTQISFANRGDGTYNFEIISDKGCPTLGSVNVIEPDPITEVSNTLTPVTCGGSGIVTDLGAIDLEIAGGTPGYIYRLVDASDLFTDPLVLSTTAPTTPNPTPVTASTSVRFEGLDFGQYYVFVEDVNGCVEGSPFGPFDIFSPPTDLIQNIRVFGDCPSGVTFEVDVQGGSGITPPVNPPPGFDIRIVGEPVPGLGDFVPLDDSVGGPTAVDANTPIRDHTYTGLSFNRSYILEVRDNATGCLYQELVAPEPPPSNPNIINTVVSDVSCNETLALDDGEISFDISGYTTAPPAPPALAVSEVNWEIFDQITNVSLNVTLGSTAYSGNITGLTGADVPVTVSDLPPGQYYVFVEEVDGTQCPTRFDFRIDIPDPLTSIITNQTPANSCGTNAQVIMDTDGGTPFSIPPTADGYTYEIVADGAGDPGVYSLDSNVIDLGNVAGDFDIWVADANGCSFGPVDVTVVVNPLPTIAAVFVDDCAYDNTNIIDIDATGIGTLLYQIDGGTAVVGSIDNLNHQFTVSTPGTYVITVTDDTGCPVTENVIVYDELMISAAFTVAPDCEDPTGEITTTIDSGVAQGTLTYVLQDGTGTPTGNITGDVTGIYTAVAPGDYIVVVTDDGRGVAPFCSFSTPVSIEAPEIPVLVPDTSSVTCNGSTDGIITVGLDPTSLDPDPTVVYEYRITAGPTTPIPTPYQTSPIFPGLDDGTYTVEVRATKANGTLDVVCLDTEDYIVTDPTNPTATITSTPYNCSPTNDVNLPIITLDNFTGGTGTEYEIEYTDPLGNVVGPVGSDSLDTDTATVGVQIIAPVAGIYTFIIYDANNCPNPILPVTDIPVFQIMTDAVINDVTLPTCATNVQDVTVTVTGGGGDFNFEEVTGAVPAQNTIPSGGATTTSGTFSLPAVVGTSYQFRVTDLATGCSILTDPIVIMPFDTIEAMTAVVPPAIQCFGDATGSIELTVTGHTGPYNYTVTNTTTTTVTPGSGDTTVANPLVITGLESGNIIVNVVDPATSCEDDSNIVFIDQPEELTLNLVSNDPGFCTSDGRVVVEADGGTPTYTYTATDGTFTASNSTGIFDLPGGPTPGITYTITVTDINSCTSDPTSLSVDVIQTDDPTLLPLTVDDVCTHDGSYLITATGTTNVSGGTGALQFQIDGGTIVDANNGLLSHIFDVSTPGTYQVTAFDENGCPTNTESITILPALIASADFTADPSCLDFDGTITVTISGGSDFSTNPANFTFVLNGTDSANNPVNISQNGALGTENIFTLVSAGSYTVTITDINIAAITTPCPLVIEVPELPVPVDPIITAAATPVSCIGATDGTVTATLDPTTDDDGPYTYQLFEDDGTGNPDLAQQIGIDQIDNPVFTGVPTGDYVVVVTSDRSCAGQDAIPVPNATQVTAGIVQTAYSCAADNSEVFPILTVTIEDGSQSYSISYVTPAGNTITDIDIVDADANPANGVQYEILADLEGDYLITVTDANGCATAPDATITEPVGPFLIMTDPLVTPVTDISCIVDEVVEVSIQGGSGDFLFEVIDGPDGATLPTAQDEVAGINASTFTLPRELGIYTFLITDQGTSCTIPITHEIDAFDFIDVTAVQQTPESCVGFADGEIAITITGYSGPYDFEILDEDENPLLTPITGTGNTATDPTPNVLPVMLEQGTYIVSITETAAPLCSELSNIVTVMGPAQPVMVDISPINMVESCDPANDGSFQASVTGAQGIVTYELFLTSDVGFVTSLDSNQTGLFEGLTTEDYTVRATDANGCSNTNSSSITAPNLIVLDPLVKTDITCFGDADGTITATASGGQGAGTYVYILTRPNGDIDGPTNNPVFQNLGPGIHSLIATDNLGCDTAPQSIDIIEPSELTVNFMVDRNVTCPDPTVDVTVSGTTDFTINEYIMVNVTDPQNPIETSNGNFAIFNNIPEGNYQFFVRDINGCQSPLSGGLAVIPIPLIEFELDLEAAFINCTDQNNAVVNVMNINGGTGDYTFTLTGTLDAGGDFGGNPAGVSQAESEFRDLAAGSYTYTVTTDRACSFAVPFTIVNPPLFEPIFTATPVSCFGEEDGMITIDVSGGTAGYAFAIGQGGEFEAFLNDASDGIPNQHIFEDLMGGVTYTVLAQDGNGCQEIMDFTIDEPTQLMVNIVGDITPEQCAGDNNGAVTIEITGGTPPYFTNITNNDGDFVEGMLTYDMLPGGETTIFIRDSNINCRTELVVDVPPGVLLSADLNPMLECPVWDYSTPENPVIIQGPAYTVTFDLNPGSETIDITYMLTGINGTADPTPAMNTTGEFDVLPGEYEGSMMHIDGCVEVVGTIMVEEYIPLVTPIAQMTNNPQNPNEYEIIVSGGSGDYTYFVAIIPDGLTVNDLTEADYRELDENIFSIDETADYALRVLDNRACEAIGIQRLTFINILIPNFFTPDGDGTNDFWYPRQDSSNPGIDPFFFADMEVQVFDRYGRLLAEFVGDQPGWNGIYQGKELPSGDYWFHIILNDIDNREFTGHFTLYR